MKLTDQSFFEYNWAEFVHVKYLREVLRLVANVAGTDLTDARTIEEIKFVADKYNERELHVIYTDNAGVTHDTLMKPAITDRVNELIDKRFRWIEGGDEPIKKLEIKDHYFKVTTPSTQADFLVPYIKDNGVEQSALNTTADENYLTLTLTDRATGQSKAYKVPTAANFDKLKADYEDFKTITIAKDKEQDQRLDAAEAKNTEQDQRLTAVEQKNTAQDERLTAIEKKNTERDKAVEKINETITILQAKSHDFVTQLKDPADFDAVTDNGNYFVYADVNLTGVHRPSDHWGILSVYNHTNSRIQTYVDDVSKVLFVRSGGPNGWSRWNSIIQPTALDAAFSEGSVDTSADTPTSTTPESDAPASATPGDDTVSTTTV